MASDTYHIICNDSYVRDMLVLHIAKLVIQVLVFQVRAIYVAAC